MPQKKIEPIAEALHCLGLPINESIILGIFLTNHDQIDSHSIERWTNLRQPEVSIGIKALIERGYVKLSSTAQTSKCGRSTYYYALAKSSQSIIDSIDHAITVEHTRKISLLEKVESLWDSEHSMLPTQ